MLHYRFHNHQGIHIFKRLNFGTTSASEELQMKLERILQNCKNIADDFILFAKNSKKYTSYCFANSLISTIMCTNNEKNDQFYGKVAFLMYSERVNFRPQSWKEASKLKPHRGLGSRLPSP